MRLRSSPHAPNLLQGKRHQWHTLAINVCLPQVEHIKSGKYEYPYQDSKFAADDKFLNETMPLERILRARYRQVGRNSNQSSRAKKKSLTELKKTNLKNKRTAPAPARNAVPFTIASGLRKPPSAACASPLSFSSPPFWVSSQPSSASTFSGPEPSSPSSQASMAVRAPIGAQPLESARFPPPPALPRS